MLLLLVLILAAVQRDSAFEDLDFDDDERRGDPHSRHVRRGRRGAGVMP